MDHMLILDVKLKKIKFSFLNWSFTCESVNITVFYDQFASKQSFRPSGALNNIKQSGHSSIILVVFRKYMRWHPNYLFVNKEKPEATFDGLILDGLITSCFRQNINKTVMAICLVSGNLA